MPFALSAGFASASSVVIPVGQDQWIGAQNDGSGYGSNAVVAEGGTGERLNLWMPGPPGAWQYSRRAYFGFDVSGVVLADVTAATFSVTTASDMVAGEDGRGMYYWIHTDTGVAGPEFDETTLSKNFANGLSLNANGAYLAGGAPYTPVESGAGTLLDSSAVGIASAGGLNTITFSGEALTSLLADTNGFVTISVYAGSPTGGGYGGGPIADSPIVTAGPGFQSKDMTSGTGATLTLESGA